MYGQLIPVGGGDPIPLLKENLLVGRRESCDIVLRFSNVSAHHCQLTMDGGYWYVTDKGSRNGVKVNGVRVQEKRIDPGIILSIAKHKYEVQYDPADNGAVGPPPPDVLEQKIFGTSLLERAGLSRKSVEKEPRRMGNRPDGTEESRWDLNDASAGQLQRHRARRTPKK